MTLPDLEQVAQWLRHDLQLAGERYSVEIVDTPRFFVDLTFSHADRAIAIRVDEKTDMLVQIWHSDDWPDELAGAMDQVQDVVLENETELWPKCPLHRHLLMPSARPGRVVWECPDTGREFAEVGALPPQFQP